MSQDDRKTGFYPEYARVSRRKFLTAAAVSAGGASTLSVPFRTPTRALSYRIETQTKSGLEQRVRVRQLILLEV